MIKMGWLSDCFWGQGNFNADSDQNHLTGTLTCLDDVKGTIQAYNNESLELSVTELYDKGWKLTNLGESEEAITYYDKALEIEPDNVMVMLGLSKHGAVRGDRRANAAERSFGESRDRPRSCHRANAGQPPCYGQ